MTLTPEKSLSIISEMISDAKENFCDQSFYLLLWGWIVAIAGLLHFVLLTFTSYAHPYYAWALMIIGFIASFAQGYRRGKQKHRKSHLERIVAFIWLSFLVSYFIILLNMPQVNYQVTPLIFIFAAISTFVSGSVIKFKPLMAGGIFLWIMGFIQFYLPENYQLLSIPFTVGIGYLLPGYLLRAKAKA